MNRIGREALAVGVKKVKKNGRKQCAKLGNQRQKRGKGKLYTSIKESTKLPKKLSQSVQGKEIVNMLKKSIHINKRGNKSLFDGELMGYHQSSVRIQKGIGEVHHILLLRTKRKRMDTNGQIL